MKIPEPVDLAAAFARIECQNVMVDTLTMSPKMFKAITDTHLMVYQVAGLEYFVNGVVWNAKIVISNDIPESHIILKSELPYGIEYMKCFHASDIDDARCNICVVQMIMDL